MSDDSVMMVSLKALTEKIERQDAHIDQLQAELQRAREASAASVLGQLRLREAVLVYLGADPAALEHQLSRTLGSAVTQDALRHLVLLDDAPAAREELRRLINGGVTRSGTNRDSAGNS